MKQSSECSIEVHNVWKLFGERHQEAFQAITASNLSKKQILEDYDCVVGVADVSFRVEPGQIYCIMGLSGSGKSTLVRHINRLLEPTHGKIFINGMDVMSFDEQALQSFRNEHIAMVFQNFALMPHRSVLDNIALPLEIRGIHKNKRLEIAAHYLHLVELAGWGNKFANELSGGMQQRVGLARALAADPDILLMDEPFSALDPLIRNQLQDQFMKLSAQMKKTTLFITHDLDEAVRIGDKIAIMRDGRIVQEDTPENIVLHPADDYVSDFVAGISRLKVVKAHSVMTPLEDFEKEFGSVGEDCPRFFSDTRLSTLIQSAIEVERPIVVTDPNHQKLGVIQHKDLLKMIIAGE